MKVIPLTQGLFAKVDDIDYERVINQSGWMAVFVGNRYYARSNNQLGLYLHNFIMGSKGIDHINLDGLDNQRSNLRPATKSQNAMNQGKRNTPTSSRFKGVYYNKGKNKWAAEIKKDGVKRFLGYFDFEEDAALAYDQAATEWFGEFARTNKAVDVSEFN